jgi:hypothetical protein
MFNRSLSIKSQEQFFSKTGDASNNDNVKITITAEVQHLVTPVVKEWSNNPSFKVFIEHGSKVISTNDFKLTRVDNIFTAEINEPLSLLTSIKKNSSRNLEVILGHFVNTTALICCDIP